MSTWVCSSCKKTFRLEPGSIPVSCCYCGGSDLSLLPGKQQERQKRITEAYEKELEELVGRMNPKAEEVRRIKSELAPDLKRFREIIAYFSQAKHRGIITEEQFRTYSSKFVGLNAKALAKKGKQIKTPHIGV